MPIDLTAEHSELTCLAAYYAFRLSTAVNYRSRTPRYLGTTAHVSADFYRLIFVDY